MNPLTYVVINVAVILLIKNGAIHVDSGNITQGELIALYNYMTQILVELIKLASLIITLNKASASAKRISDIFDTPDDIDFAVSAETSDSDDVVRFENVSFKYSNESDGNVIESLSFSVKPGETVGIIGGTGSGKTTVINLLSGFYHANEGNIFVNGKNASLLGETERKEIFGIVPQKATLFAGTIRSNLLLGDENANDEELWSALELAMASEFVKDKPNGLDETVTQGGTNFSGGQKQRLTVARALVRKPQILILDDSSSALDYATEAAMRRNISALDYSPTVFIISQRASSVMHANTIIVLDDGVAVGIGTHQELLNSCELYKEIYDVQFSEGGERK